MIKIIVTGTFIFKKIISDTEESVAVKELLSTFNAEYLSSIESIQVINI